MSKTTPNRPVTKTEHLRDKGEELLRIWAENEENMAENAALHAACEQLGIDPCYFVDYVIWAEDDVTRALPDRQKICFNCQNWGHDIPDFTDERRCELLAEHNPPDEDFAPVTYAGFTCLAFRPTEKREMWTDHDLDSRPKGENELPFRWDPIDEVAR